MSFNPRQQAFIDNYLIYRNASKSARLAGYNGASDRIGPRLLGNVGIKQEIDRRLKEKHLSADEVLARLADMAYADIRDFVRIEQPEDLLQPRYKGKTHVIKKFKKTTVYTKDGDKIITTELELYDSQSALEKLGRHHALFTDRVQVDWRIEIVNSLKRGEITPQDIINEFGDGIEAKALLESAGLLTIEGRAAEVYSENDAMAD